jgi:RHS repeat-associated protein
VRTRLVVTGLCGLAVLPLIGLPAVGDHFSLAILGGVAMEQAPIVDFANNAPFYIVERSACLTVSLGPSAASECGSLRVAHPLPSVRTFNSVRTPTLIYNSDFAHPYVVLPIRVGMSSTTTQPVSVELQLFEYVPAPPPIYGIQVPKGTWTWSGSHWPSGQSSTKQVAVSVERFNGMGDTTCYCVYQAKVTNIYPNNVRKEAPWYQFGVFVVHRATSPFGAGWWLAGLEKLLVNGPWNQMVWFDGDGSVRFFLTQDGNTWWSGVYDKVDTIYRSGSPGNYSYIKTNAEGVRTHFNYQGRHTKTVDRFGRTTDFYYDGNGRLDRIVLPPAAQEYKFTYTGGRLDSIIAPQISAQQKRAIRFGGSGNLITSITDPGSPAVQFTYLAGPGNEGLIETRTDRRGTLTTFAYNAGRKIQSSRLHMPNSVDDVIWGLTPGLTQGLYGPGPPVDTTQVATQVNGPRTDVSDVTTFRQTQFGAVARLINAVSDSTVVHYGCYGEISTGVFPYQYPCNWVPLRVRPPSGRVLRAVYNVYRGPLLRLIDSITTVPGQRDSTRYEWDPKFDQLTKIVPHLNDSVIFYVDPTNGNRLWQENRRGLSSRVTFSYYTSAYGAAKNAQLWKVDGPLTTASELDYDAMGNVSSHKSPKGHVTHITRDAVGRETLIRNPLDSSGTISYRARRLVYDLLDRITEEVDSAPSRSGMFSFQSGATKSWAAPLAKITVNRVYDNEGNVENLTRSSLPNSVGNLTTTWTYDKANRRKSEQAPDGVVDSLVYDPAGNVVTAWSKLGVPNHFAYDALNRLITKTVGAVSYSEWTHGFPSTGGQVAWTLPRYSDGLSLSQEITTFAYDAMGNLTYAKNPYAITNRSYNIKNLLEAETQRIRTWAGNDTTTHAYTLAYGYDRNNRIISITHPTSIAPRINQVLKNIQTFHYHDTLGLADTLKDVLGNAFVLRYDLENRIDSLIYPGGVVQKRTYHEERFIRRELRATRHVGTDSGFAVADLYKDSLMIDPQGRIARVGSAKVYYTGFFAGEPAITWYGYSGLDGVVRRDFRQSAGTSYKSERSSLDGFANQTASWSIGGGPFSEVDDSLNSLRVYAYQTGSPDRGRLGQYSHPIAGALDTRVDTEVYTYDATGNTIRRFGDRSISTGYLRSAAAGYYDNEGRLRVFNRLSCLLVIPGGQGGEPTECNYNSSTPLYSTSVHETYWYDGLGRRVLVRSRQDSTCTNPNRGECGSFIERTVWDRDQPLYEIRYPGGDNQTPAQLEQDTGFVAGPQHNYGRVVYLNGLGIDEPLGLVRVGYSSHWEEGVAIVPHANMAGVYDFGSFHDGQAKRCKSYSPDTNCLVLDWPGRVLGQSVYFGPSEFNVQLTWQGNQIARQRDLSGQMYLRNRFYDPTTGRFTQEDPIGLAGGLNLYGFANGDPVNFSDPFGLFPCPPCFAFADPEVVFSSVAGSLPRSGPDWKAEVLFGLAAAMMAAADDGRADGSEIQQLRNSLGSRRAAFRAAKSDMGIARSAQPLRVARVRDKHTGSLLRQYEFRNANGEIIQIREDLPRIYSDGGRQGPHFNAGRAGDKLREHYYFPQKP